MAVTRWLLLLPFLLLQICDDFYGLHWALRRALRHPAYAPDSPDGYGGTASVTPAVAASGVPEVINLITDSWPFDLPGPSQRLASRFHHVLYTDAAGLRAGSGGAELLCFKHVLMGTPSISFHRNAAYAWAEPRTWPHPLNDATQQEDEQAFAHFFTARALAAAGVDVRKYTLPQRDTIVVIERTGKRRWADVEEVVRAVKAAALWRPPQPRRQSQTVDDATRASLLDGDSEAQTGTVTQLEMVEPEQPVARAGVTQAAAADRLRLGAGNYTVVRAVIENLPDAQVVQLMQRAVMMIGVHGAGLTNMLHMQPGSVVLEVTPPSSPQTALYFAAIAHNIGLRHATVVAASKDPKLHQPIADFDDPVQVHADALRGMVDMLLASVDGRRPT